MDHDSWFVLEGCVRSGWDGKPGAGGGEEELSAIGGEPGAGWVQRGMHTWHENALCGLYGLRARLGTGGSWEREDMALVSE